MAESHHVSILDHFADLDDPRVECTRRHQLRVDSGGGQNRTLRPLSTFWPPVFAGEQDVGPPKG